MIKNNPYELLEDEHISQKLLSENALASLKLFDKAKMLFEKHPKSKEMKENAEKAGKITVGVIEKEITRVKSELKNEAEENNKKEIKKGQSKKIVEKAEVILDELEICRKKLKEDRERKIESGEIQRPKKKTLITKLRGELLRTATLIPKSLKEDKSVIQRTQKAVLTFLTELKSIWGLNKIKPIEDDLKEKFQKLQEQAAKE